MFRDRVQHGLHIGRRTGDHAEDLGDRGLLLQRLLRLVEQADVLDRDRRLAGEGLDQRDLVRGEHSRLAPEEEDASVGAAFADQGHRQHGPAPHSLHVLARARKLAVEQRNDVLEVNGQAIDRRAAGERSPVKGNRKGIRDRAGRVLGSRTQQVAVGKQDPRVRRIA